MANDIYQDSGIILTAFCGHSELIKECGTASCIQITVLPDKFIALNFNQVKKIIDVLQDWINSKEQIVFNYKIVGESKPIPKLLINKKEKILTIDGIEFMVDGKIVKLSAKEFVKLQDLVLSIYYG